MEHEGGMVGSSQTQDGTKRRCAYEGCTTTLSIYNVDVLCFVHADERTRAGYDRASGRMRPQQTREAEPSTAPSSYQVLAGTALVVLRIVDP